MRLRDLFVREVDRRVANEGVAKVWDRGALREELAEYVLTETLERNLRQFLALFVESMDTRGSAQAVEAMAAWCSGFFGSGKSHFVKVLGHLLANDVVDEASAKSAIEVFRSRLPDESPHKTDIEGYLHQIDTRAWCLPVFLEVKSRQDLISRNSIAEICLSAFYETCGYSPDIRVARHELFMQRKGFYPQFRARYQELHGEPWEQARKDYYYHQDLVAEVVAECSPEYGSPDQAARALGAADENVTVDAQGFATELFDYLDARQRELPQRRPHVVFILDELQQFIGEDNDRIEEVRTIVETLGARGKGRVWVVATGQEALDRVLDRAGLRLEGLGKLNARFGCHLMLGTEDVQRVVEERLLRKREAHRPHLEAIYDAYDGYLPDLCRLNTERNLPPVTRDTFVVAYPFLPYQPFLAQEIFDSMRGTKLAGTPRSMLDVTHAILRRLADEPCSPGEGGVRLVSFDLVYDEIKSELYSEDFLGSHGVRAIDEADKQVDGWSLEPTRVLKALWLAQRLNWIPRTSACLCRLLVTDLGQDLDALQSEVEKTLGLLRDAGYVGFDEATKQYRYLSAEEGEVEKAIHDQISKMGKAVGPTLRRCRELTRDSVLTRAKLTEFRVTYGSTGALFDYALTIDGEAVQGRLRDPSKGDNDGEDLMLACLGPLTTESDATIDKQNVAAGAKGNVIWWTARPSAELATSLKRLIVLEGITADPKHTTGRSPKYLEAIQEKAVERDALRDKTLVPAIEDAYRRGTVYFAGESRTLDGKADLKNVVQDAFAVVIPNLYTRFAPADKPFEAAKDALRFLTPSVKPRDVATALGVFDSADQLILSHALIEPVIDCLRDREDAEGDPDGGSLEQYFGHVPFGWSGDLLRTLMAACFRGGAVTVAAGRTFYDYTESDSQEYFTKPTKFRKAYFRAIKTGLTEKQITEACALLASVGVAHVQHSATAIARAARKLAEDCSQVSERASRTVEFGVPLPETYKLAPLVCAPVVHEEDPTVVVTAFLASSDKWQAVCAFGNALNDFLKAKRAHAYLEAERLAAVCAGNPVLQRSPQADEAAKALADMAQVRDDRAILDRWSAYNESATRLEGAFRTCYRTHHDALATAAINLRAEVEALAEFQELAPERRQAVMDGVFGPASVLGIGDTPDLSTRTALLAANQRYGLTALEALAESVAAHRDRLVAAIRQALDEQRAAAGQKVPKVKRVAVTSMIRGKRVSNESELDGVLGQVRNACRKALKPNTTVEIE